MFTAVQSTLDARERADALTASNERDAAVDHRNQELRVLNREARERDAAKLAPVLTG